MPDERLRNSRVAVALATGATHAEAARAAETSARTVRRLAQDPDVLAEAHDVRRVLMDALVGRLLEAGADAVAVLHSTCTDGSAPHYVRVRAAVAIVEALLKVREHAELAERVRRLESANGGASE